MGVSYDTHANITYTKVDMGMLADDDYFGVLKVPLGRKGERETERVKETEREWE